MTDPDPRIREATPADLPQVRQLLVETWHATYDGIYGARRVTEITDDWHSLDNLAVQLRAADTVFLVAEASSRIDATSLARDKSRGLVMLDRLYVRSGRQGLGLGSALLQATLNRFPRAGLVRLEVEPQSHRAIAFYERHGFSIVSQTADCGGRSSIVAHVMQRSQAPVPLSR